MLQDILLTSAAAAAAAAPAGGSAASNAEALQQLGFSHMIQNLDIVSAGVLFFLVVPLASVLALEAVRTVTGWDAGYPAAEPETAGTTGTAGTDR